MAADNFRHAEDEYFKLRGQFDTGRLTQEQFDEKLRELMQQDDQGRYWMLGADSAKWYFYDGTKWVQSEPYQGKAPPSPPPTEIVPAVSAIIPPAPTPPAPLPPAPAAPTPPPRPRPIPAPVAVTPTARGGSRDSLPLVPILLVLLLLILVAIGFLVYQNRDRIFVAQAPNQVTPVLPPNITRTPSPTTLSALPTAVQPTLQPTLAPLPTAVSTAVPAELPTQVAATNTPTSVPATSAPAVTIIVVTATAQPTLSPSATVKPTVGIPTTTPLPATATNSPPTATALPDCPTGVCVTQIVYAPDQPRRNQDITFTATFLNSTGGTSYYKWVIFAYHQGQSKRFGESSPQGISIPAGVSTFSLPYTMVKGPGGGCEDDYVRAGWKVSSVEDHEFPNTTGGPASVSLSVCP